jgi:hypothetical protein
MATDTTTDEVATWQVITGSARGAAHRASGLPNQDAVASHDVTGGVVVAIADGHGHIRHFRSADGAALDGRRTTSLCQPDALASFRTGAHDLREVPLAALLLATDGYGNAQADEPWQPSVGRDLAELAACHDRHWFEQEVPGWARRCASAEGSGDDATIALLLPGDARDAEEDG